MAFESLDKRQQALCAPFNFLANKERSAGIYLMIKPVSLAPGNYWGPWSSFSPCSKTCGDGFRTRTRACFSDGESSQTCEGPSQESQDCNWGECGEGLWGSNIILISKESFNERWSEPLLFVGFRKLLPRTRDTSFKAPDIQPLGWRSAILLITSH